MSPNGSSYAIKLPITISGSAQLDRVLQAITSLRSEVTQLGGPLRTLSSDTAALAVSMGLLADNSKGAARGIRSFVTQLKNYIKTAQQAQGIPSPAALVPGAGGGGAPGGSGGRPGGGGGGPGGGGGGRDLGGFFARVGGRLGGQATGIPGGGFIGAQTIGALGISGATGFAVGGALAGAVTAYALVKNANDTAKYAQEQTNLAKELGTTAQFTQLLGRVSEVTGVQTSGLVGMLKDLNKSITSTGEESKKTQRALGELGLSSSVAFEKPEQQINDVLAALKKIGNESERERLAVNLFKDAGLQLLPLVDVFGKISDSVKRSGVIIGSDGIKSLDAYTEATGRLKLKWDALTHSIGEATASAITFFLGDKDKPGDPGQASRQQHARDVERQAAVNIRHGADRETEYAKVRAARAAVYIAPPVDQGVARGEALREEARANYRKDQIESTQNSVLGAPEVARKRLAAATTKSQEAEEGLRTGRGTQDQYNSALRAQEKAKNDLDAANQAAEELRSQRRRLKELSGKTFTFSETPGVLRNLPEELSRLTGTDQYRRLAGRLSGPAAAYASATEEEKNPQERFIRRLSEQAARENERNPDAILPGFIDLDTTPQERARKRREESQGRAASEVYRGSIADIKGNLGIVEAQSGLEGAIRSAQLESSRDSLGPQAYARARLGETLSSTSESYKYQIDAAGSEATAAFEAAKKQPLGSAENSNLLAQADTKNLEVKTLLLDAETKQIEAISKFNQSIDEAAKAVRDQISGGLTSLVIAAQQPGGRALRPAAKGLLEGQESIILKNIFNETLGSAFNGKNPIGASGPLGKILQGTIFSPVDNKVALNANTSALLGLTTAITGRPANIGGGGAGIADIPPATVAAGSGLGSNIPSPFSTAGSGLGGYNPSTGTFAPLVSGVAAATGTIGSLSSPGGASPASILGDISHGIGSVGSALGGNFGAGVGSVLNGNALSVLLGQNTTGPTTTSAQIGAGVGIAGALATGAGVIDRGLVKGGLGGDLTAAGGAVGLATTAASSVAKLLGAALPSFVPILGGVISAVLPLIGGIFGSSPQKRQNAITSELSANQYIAPTALNVTQSSNGTLGSFDARGNYRTTGLSAVPTVSEGSVYTQTHGLFGGPPTYYDIPGRTITPYSGTVSGTGTAPVAGASAAVPHVTIMAMDSESFVNFAVKNNAAFGAALTAHLYSGDTATHSAIKFATAGLR